MPDFTKYPVFLWTLKLDIVQKSVQNVKKFPHCSMTRNCVLQPEAEIMTWSPIKGAI